MTNPKSDQQAAAVATAAVVGPVGQRDRIFALDVLRGVGLLGILVMNISSFGLHEGFDFHPLSTGNIETLNLSLWAARFVLFEGKMRGVFSLLFGAGAILLTSRIEARVDASRAAEIFQRRNLWLIAIGLIHGYFIWFGDILYAYGLTAVLFLYPCRRLKAKTLIACGVLVFAVLGVYKFTRYETRMHLYERGRAAEQLEGSGQKLSDEQNSDLKAYQKMKGAFRANQKELEEESAGMRGGYWTVMKRYASITSEVDSTVYYRFDFCDYLGMMLIGMGLLRAGFLTAQLPYRTYAWVALVGYGFGLSLGVLSVSMFWRRGFGPEGFAWLTLPYDLQRLPVALAHASLALMMVKAGALKWITKPLAAVGQTALSNYLGTSVICTLIFNGYGLGLFGKLQFYQLFYVVAGVWAVNLIASPIWLKYFRFGPVEWVWRSLTYWKVQPMRRVEAAPPAGVATAEA